jgi:hypothetical protein
MKTITIGIPTIYLYYLRFEKYSNIEEFFGAMIDVSEID